MPVITSNHHHNSTEGVLMIINTNMGSATAARILANNTSALQKSLKRLSTGSRIADLQDDSAGAAVAQKHSAHIERLKASTANLGNMISLSQTQDGYMEQVAGALERMSELAMLSTDETKSGSDRALYQKEFEELQKFVDNISDKQFNGTALFSSNALNVRTDISTTVSFTGADLTANTYNKISETGATVSVAISTTAAASTALSDIQAAIGQLASDRAQVGANLSRLYSEKSAIAILRDNISQARSRILDVDVAEESANFAKNQILVQSGTAMLAQANVLPQTALRLIGN
jgi:flagellin